MSYKEYKTQYLRYRRQFKATSGLDLGEPMTEAEFNEKYGV